MEANALNPDTMDPDNATYDCDDNTDQNYADEEGIAAVHKDSVYHRCGSKGHFAKKCATPISVAMDRGRDGKGNIKKPIIYSTKTATRQRTMWTKWRSKSSACGLMASIEVEGTDAPLHHWLADGHFAGSHGHRAKSMPPHNRPRNHHSSIGTLL